MGSSDVSLAASVVLAIVVLAGIALALRAAKAMARERSIRESSTHAPSTLQIAIERDTVHASDDERLTTTRTVDAGLRVSRLLMQLQADRFLPGIHGGRATWVVESGEERRAIAIVAEQWRTPRLHIVDVTLAQHFYGRQPVLYFDYRAQVDPDEVSRQIG